MILQAISVTHSRKTFLSTTVAEPRSGVHSSSLPRDRYPLFLRIGPNRIPSLIAVCDTAPSVRPSFFAACRGDSLTLANAILRLAGPFGLSLPSPCDGESGARAGALRVLLRYRPAHSSMSRRSRHAAHPRLPGISAMAPRFRCDVPVAISNSIQAAWNAYAPGEPSWRLRRRAARAASTPTPTPL
jgi:hypothetical protein